MPTPTWIDIARKPLHPRLAERNDTLQWELRTRQAAHARRGLLGSGVVLSAISNLAAVEMPLDFIFQHGHGVMDVST